MRTCEDLTGKQFGNLTVIENIGIREYNKKTSTYWKCVCECGNTIEIPHGYLKSGKKTHCGCMRKGNIQGKKFGRLTAISTVGKNKHNEILWKCKCDCGNEKIVSYNVLVNGKSKSCGCLAIENNYKHGLYGTRIRGIYYKMLNRCNHKESVSYLQYGGRGITVCEEWSGENGLINFYNWSMKNGYSDELSIDRIDNDKGYSPGNCRWTTNYVQQNNKRNNIVLEYCGKSLTLKQWSRETGISYKKLLYRYHKGLQANQILSNK